ncbi:MAG: ribose 5-phosphate isomerase B [Bacteroidales bacterium]|nr:ribose 5-phosphate isomerase B [Bacteroidales bacterium]
MKIYIGSDHAGYDLKEQIKQHFTNGFEWIDLGTDSTASVDYPNFAHPVAQAVAENTDNIGILICGTGNGMAMTANKHQNIRAALCWSKEIAALARQHNNANILVLPARFIPAETAFEMIETFLSTPFEGGRHLNRVNKINL